jgi:phage major head subunit gpT-like protein
MERRSDFGDLLDPVIRDFIDEGQKQLPEKRGLVFNELDSSKNIETDSSMSGISDLDEIPEGDNITYEDRTQGYDVTYTHRKFGKGIAVTEELWDDDQHGQIRKAARDLGRARVRHSEKLAADIFNYGTTAGGGGKATFTSGDAKALFATDHPRTDGGTAQSNLSTADLAEDALEAAMLQMAATVDDKGQGVVVQPTTLLVPRALEKEARILLDSMQRTGTANNDINPYKGALDLIVWDYLGTSFGGSDTAWYLIDRNVAGLNWFWRKRPVTKGPEEDFDSGAKKWKLTYRASVGFSDWRGVFASTGTNA